MKAALVTGAATRGGAAIARELHRRGLTLLLHHSPRSAVQAKALAGELNATRSASAATWCADFSEPVIRVPGWVVDAAVEVCVCNASVWEASTLADCDRAATDWNVHVASHAAVLAALRASLRSIVTITDVHADRPARGHLWYTTTKAALQAMTMALAADWSPRVRCNVVQPGTLPWPEGWSDRARQESVLRGIPLAREGSFEDLAATVSWIALDAHYVTGQILAVDGGRSRVLCD